MTAASGRQGEQMVAVEWEAKGVFTDPSPFQAVALQSSGLVISVWLIYIFHHEPVMHATSKVKLFRSVVEKNPS